MFDRFRASALAAALVSTGLVAHPLSAQEFPTRPVTIVVPSTAGGGTDIIARIIGDQLSKQLGQAFVIENRPGAGSVVGTVAAANAAPDGYTLLAGLNANMAVNPSLFAKLPYDPIRDFAPVARSEEHTSELQSRLHLVCRLLLEKKKQKEYSNFLTKKKKKKKKK